MRAPASQAHCRVFQAHAPTSPTWSRAGMRPEDASRLRSSSIVASIHVGAPLSLTPSSMCTLRWPLSRSAWQMTSTLPRSRPCRRPELCADTSDACMVAAMLRSVQARALAACSAC